MRWNARIAVSQTVRLRSEWAIPGADTSHAVANAPLDCKTSTGNLPFSVTYVWIRATLMHLPTPAGAPAPGRGGSPTAVPYQGLQYKSGTKQSQRRGRFQKVQPCSQGRLHTHKIHRYTRQGRTTDSYSNGGGTTTLLATGSRCDCESYAHYMLIICSFALHMVEKDRTAPTSRTRPCPNAVQAAMPLPTEAREGSSGLVGDACACQLDGGVDGRRPPYRRR